MFSSRPPSLSSWNDEHYIPKLLLQLIMDPTDAEKGSARRIALYFAISNDSEEFVRLIRTMRHKRVVCC
jgi:hypothetical protein